MTTTWSKVDSDGWHVFVDVLGRLYQRDKVGRGAKGRIEDGLVCGKVVHKWYFLAGGRPIVREWVVQGR